MREFGKVSPRFWVAGSGRRMRGNSDAQFLALYLMTCPSSSMSGLFTLSLPAMCHELGLPEKRVRAALEALHDEDVAHFDEAADLVWVPNMIRYQVGERLEQRDNRVPALIRELAPFRGHPFLTELIQRSQGAFCIPESLAGPLRRGFETTATPNGSPLEAPSEGLEANGEPLLRAAHKPLRSQEQETEQETETEQEQTEEKGLAPLDAFLVPAKGDEAGRVADVAVHYRGHHPRAFPRGIALTSKEGRYLKGRLREGFTVEDLKQCIDGFHMSPFHCGLNDRNQVYLGLELMVRDAKHVQQGIELFQRGPPAALTAKDKGTAYAVSSWMSKSAGGDP